MIAIALSLLLAAGAAAEEPVSQTPAKAVAAAVRFTPPKGWTPDAYANAGGADPVARYEKGSDAIVIRLFGGAGSDYATPAEFLAGPAASEEGAASVPAGTTTVAGRKVELRRRRFPIEVADPHRAGPTSKLKGAEVFLVLPLKGARFAVLAYRRETPIPDLHQAGEKAWAAFLKTVRPR